jgi:ribosomal protein S18 acetylase RimI-like enzyme
MPEITIRPATPADIDRLIDILYDDPAPDIRAVEPDARKAKRLGALTIRNGLQIAIERTAVAVVDGQPVALLDVVRPGEGSDPGPLAIARVVLGGIAISGLAGLLRMLRYGRVRPRVRIDHPPEAFYIGELDVHPDYRNRGTGAELLKHAEAEARAEGFAQMALTTGISNPAQHLYKRCGFEIVETKRDAMYEKLTGNPGRVLMVKSLG